MPRFKIGERIYHSTTLEDLSLKDIVLFNQQADEIGLQARWADLEQASEEIAEMTVAEADRHPHKFLVIAATVWASRRLAGEDLAFGEAIDFPASDFVLLPEPEDKKPGKPKGASKPRKAPKKTVASSPAGDPEPETMRSTVSETPTPTS